MDLPQGLVSLFTLDFIHLFLPERSDADSNRAPVSAGIPTSDACTRSQCNCFEGTCGRSHALGFLVRRFAGSTSGHASQVRSHLEDMCKVAPLTFDAVAVAARLLCQMKVLTRLCSVTEPTDSFFPQRTDGVMSSSPICLLPLKGLATVHAPGYHSL